MDTTATETTTVKKQINEAINLNLPQREFLKFVYTCQMNKTRLKGIDETEAVHIEQKFIEREFFKFPQYIREDNINELIERGELERTKLISPSTGHPMYVYRALNPQPYNLPMLLRYRQYKPLEQPVYGKETIKMREYLKRVSLPDVSFPEGAKPRDYFKLFLDNKDQYLELFFTVCDFAHRVHTPITNLDRRIRPFLLIDGCTTVGLDVKTMQPLLLGKILKQNVGNNDYTNWINSGEDIYVKLQTASGLETRDQGKKRFFELAFGYPNSKLAEAFGSGRWINWINEYKSKPQPGNPHKDKVHNNLAWLLQTTEVKVMQKVWRQLNSLEIPFLSVHDEIIVKQPDRHTAERIFRSVLSQEFEYYQLNVKEFVNN